MNVEHHEVVVVGGGTGGVSVAARMLRRDPSIEIAIVEPAETHYYQPLWTLVGAGLFSLEESARPMADVIPKRTTWIRDRVAELDPQSNRVELESGKVLSYDHLVVAPGIQLDWSKIEGLPAALGHDGVTSNYSVAHVDYTSELLERFDGGRALFTFPNTPIKCAGAPQKIMWLAEEKFRDRGIRERSEIVFASAGAAIFGVPRYRTSLEKLVAERKIETRFRQDLVAVRPASHEAVFRNLETQDESVVRYDLLHVSPPQSAPDFVKRSPLAQPGPLGWVDVDAKTLQHVRYPNVFGLGDASSLPCSKTGAAIRKQSPVLVENLLALRAGKALTAHYDGYASCPLVTSSNKVILAEFGYDGKIMETFPIDQSKERHSMYILKAHVLPKLYWHGMMRGLV